MSASRKSVSNARASSQDAKSQPGSPCITLSTAASPNLLAVVREPSGTKRPRDTEDQLDSTDYSKSPAEPAPTVTEDAVAVVKEDAVPTAAKEEGAKEVEEEKTTEEQAEEEDAVPCPAATDESAKESASLTLRAASATAASTETVVEEATAEAIPIAEATTTAVVPEETATEEVNEGKETEVEDEADADSFPPPVLDTTAEKKSASPDRGALVPTETTETEEEEKDAVPAKAKSATPARAASVPASAPEVADDVATVVAGESTPKQHEESALDTANEQVATTTTKTTTVTETITKVTQTTTSVTATPTVMKPQSQSALNNSCSATPLGKSASLPPTVEDASADVTGTA